MMARSCSRCRRVMPKRSRATRANLVQPDRGRSLQVCALQRLHRAPVRWWPTRSLIERIGCSKPCGPRDRMRRVLATRLACGWGDWRRFDARPRYRLSRLAYRRREIHLPTPVRGTSAWPPSPPARRRRRPPRWHDVAHVRAPSSQPGWAAPAARRPAAPPSADPSHCLLVPADPIAWTCCSPGGDDRLDDPAPTANPRRARASSDSRPPRSTARRMTRGSVLETRSGTRAQFARVCPGRRGRARRRHRSGRMSTRATGGARGRHRRGRRQLWRGPPDRQPEQRATAQQAPGDRRPQPPEGRDVPGVLRHRRAARAEAALRRLGPPLSRPTRSWCEQIRRAVSYEGFRSTSGAARRRLAGGRHHRVPAQDSAPSAPCSRRTCSPPSRATRPPTASRRSSSATRPSRRSPSIASPTSCIVAGRPDAAAHHGRARALDLRHRHPSRARTIGESFFIDHGTGVVIGETHGDRRLT